MGAPKTAYGAYNIWLTGTKEDTTPISREFGVAKFIRTTSGNNGYFLDSDIVGEDQSLAVAKVKSIFKLDRLESIKADGISGFIGQVRCDVNGVPIGPNAIYHRDFTDVIKNRYSGLIDTVKDINGDVKYYHYFNDAGLNTKGDIIPGNWPNVKTALLNHGVLVTATVKAAFYSGQNKWGFKMKADGTDHPENAANYSEAAYTTVYQETIGINTTKVLNDTLVVADQEYILLAPNKYLTSMYITNEEGTYEVEMFRVRILPYLRRASFGNTLIEASQSVARDWYFNSSTLIWKDAITGNPADINTSMSLVASNLGMTSIGPDGFYMFSESDETPGYRGYVQVENGVITGWNEPSILDPTGGFNLQQVRSLGYYYGFHHRLLAAAYDTAENNAFEIMGSYYSDKEDLKIYSAQSPSNYHPGTGYYILSPGVGETMEEKLATCGYMRLDNDGNILSSSEEV